MIMNDVAEEMTATATMTEGPNRTGAGLRTESDAGLSDEREREALVYRLVNASRASLEGLLAGVTDDLVLGMAFARASRKDDWAWRCPLISKRRSELKDGGGL